MNKTLKDNIKKAKGNYPVLTDEEFLQMYPFDSDLNKFRIKEEIYLETLNGYIIRDGNNVYAKNCWVTKG